MSKYSQIKPNENKRESLYLSLLFSFVIIVLPFTGSQELIDPKLAPRHLLISVFTFFLVLYALFRYKRLTLYYKYFLYSSPLLILFLLYSITTFTAHNFGEAVFWAIKFGVYFSLFFILFIFNSNHLLRKEYISSAVIITIFIALGLFFGEVQEKEMLKTTTLLDKNLHALSSPFGHKNLFSSFLILCIPFSVIGLLSKIRPLQLLSFVSIVSIPILIFLLQTKAALLGLVIGCVVSSPIVFYLLKKKYPSLFPLLLSIIGLCLGLCLFLIFHYRENIGLLLASGSAQERIIFWKNTLSLIGEHFFIGVGGGNWQFLYPKTGLNDFYQLNNNIHFGFETIQRPHNDFLWVFIESGFLGFLAFVSLFAIAIYHSLKQLKIVQSLKKKISLITFCFTFIAYAVISFFDFPLERSEHQLLFIYLLVLVTPTPSKKSKTFKKKAKVILLILLLIISFIAVFHTIIRINEEKKQLNVLRFHKHGNWKAMIKQADKINKKWYPVDNFSIPIYWYMGVASYSLEKNDLALSYFQKAYDVHPYQVQVISNLASMYHKNGEQNKAIHYYDKALAIASHQPDIRLNKSIILLKNNKIEESFANLLQIVYKKEYGTLYHKSMKEIFNAYLKELQKNNGNYSMKSLKNIEQNDSLKVVLLYEYQINNKNLDTLLNTFDYNMD